MIVLGVDWGKVRTGVAVSDELGLLAHPRTFVEETSIEKLAALLADLAKQYRVNEIVMGLPVNMDGSEGESAGIVRDLGERLHKTAGLPVFFQDERLSTWEAERFLSHECGVSGKKRKKVKDQMAACLILQRYLDAKRSGLQK